MPRQEIRAAQFGLVSGIQRPTSDMVLAVEPGGLFAPEARKGRLYIVAETDQDVARGRDACQLVMRAIRKHFYGDTSFSVTASLRKAIIAANRALYQQNFGTPTQKRAHIGVTCVVVKDGDLYVAQVTPAQLYLRTEGRVRALPALPTGERQDRPAFVRPNALGNSLTCEPDFYRAVLRPGDSLVAGTSNMARIVSPEALTSLLRASEPAAAAVQLAERLRGGGLAEAHGVVVGAFAGLSKAAQTAPLSPAGVSERAVLAARSVGDQAARLSGELALLVKGPTERAARRRREAAREQDRREAARLGTLPDDPVTAPIPAPLPRPLDLGPPVAELAATQFDRWRLDTLQVRPEELRRLPPSAFLGESGYVAPQRERPIDLGDAAVGQDVRAGRATLPPNETPFGPRRGPFGQFVGALTSVGRRRAPRQMPPRAVANVRRPPGLSYRRQRPPFPWLLLMLLTSLIAVLILYGTTLTNQNAVREADTSLELAEQAVAAIRSAPDDATARERLATARDALAVVQASGVVTATIDNRRRYTELEREYERALAAVQKLTYFEELEEVVRHPTPGGLLDSIVVPPPPRGITNTVGFSYYYLLDTNAGMLYRASREGGPVEPFLRPQESFGPLPVGRIRAHAWRFDNIVAVAQSGDSGPFAYYFYTGTSWNYSILAGSEVWGRVGEPFRIANYDGNLYVWGVEPGNVLRYLSGRFGEFPDPWIQNDGGEEFDSALDLAVDGQIYLLQPDGAVLVFTNDLIAGERRFEREIPAPALDPPLVATTRFFVTGADPTAGFIFLVDTDNQRVIQLDKATGELIQQVRARPDDAFDLERLNSVYVDDSTARLEIYMIVRGGQVLRATLPERPRPFQEGLTPTPTTAP
jgi:hypothetical protein